MTTGKPKPRRKMSSAAVEQEAAEPQEASNGDETYEVGYSKPPVKTRFKKGRSGNPKGRPKNARNLKTDLAEELSETIAVKENGKQRQLSKRRAMLKSNMAKALKGDPRAIRLVLDMLAQTGLLAEESDTAADGDLSQTDLEILKAFQSGLASNEGENHE